MISLSGYDAWKTREPDPWIEPKGEEDEWPDIYDDRWGWDARFGWLDDDWDGWEPT